MQQYFTENDNAVLNALIHNEMETSEVVKKFNVSKQHVFETLLNMGYQIGELRQQDLNKRANSIFHQLMEGIPLDTLERNGYLNVFLHTENQRKDSKLAKQVLVRRFVSLGLIQNSSDEKLKHILVESRFASYVKTLQIEYLIEHSNLSNMDLANKFDVSYTKIMQIKSNIDLLKQALPKVPDSLQSILKRNIKIYRDYQSEKDITSIYSDIDSDILDLIVESISPYIVSSEDVANV